MRGRVFSAFYVMRDVIFLFGMAGAGLADVVDIRLLIIFASLLLFVSAAVTLVAPGLGVRDLGRGGGPAAARGTGSRRRRPGPRPWPTSTGWSAHRRLRPAVPAQRAAFIADATVREVLAGTRILEHGDAATSAYFVLDGSTTAGVPEDGGYRGLSTMAPATSSGRSPR